MVCEKIARRGIFAKHIYKEGEGKGKIFSPDKAQLAVVSAVIDSCGLSLYLSLHSHVRRDLGI